MKTYIPKPTDEYRTMLDLPKHYYFDEPDKYPQVPGLKNTFGWFEVREMPGLGVYAVAEPYHEQNGCFYVVLGRDKAVVFDTGLGIYDPKPLVEELAQVREIIVVNSHTHFDHAGGNHFFGKVYVHLDDQVRELAEHGVYDVMVREQVRDEAFLMGVPEGFNQEAYGTEPFEAMDVTEGQIFDLGGRRLEVFFAPGHSPDGICLIDEENDLVLVGDTFYLGALYGHFPSSDMAAYRVTLDRLAARIGDETKVLCCHNEFMADGARIKQAAELFDKILDGGVTGGAREESKLNYGEEGDVKQVFGDGFSILYI